MPMIHNQFNMQFYCLSKILKLKLIAASRIVLELGDLNLSLTQTFQSKFPKVIWGMIYIS